MAVLSVDCPEPARWTLLLSQVAALLLLALRAALAPASPSALMPDVCMVARPTPYDPPRAYPRTVPLEARRPVCGM